MCIFLEISCFSGKNWGFGGNFRLKTEVLRTHIFLTQGLFFHSLLYKIRKKISPTTNKTPRNTKKRSLHLATTPIISNL